MQVGESEQARGHFPVEGERRAVAGGRAEGVLVGYVVCSHEQLHVVGQGFGICAEPQSERRRHRNLQVGVAGHKDVLVFIAKFEQLVEKTLSFRGDAAQLVAHEQFEVDEHLVVA